MIAAEWLSRAQQALNSAEMLRGSDPNGACSTAYYAMFYAARAALLHVGQAERALGKTHSGMVAAFNEFLARSAVVDPTLGKTFASELSQRLAAAYNLEGVDAETAERSLANARQLVTAVGELVARPAQPEV